MITLQELEHWFPTTQKQALLTQLKQVVGLTRVRAEYFLRLWIYLLVKAKLTHEPQLQPPLTELQTQFGAIICTHREAAELFYGDQEKGGDRAAGMMLDKLAALGLIRKYFDGNTTCIEILPLPQQVLSAETDEVVSLTLGEFNPRCDAIPVANLLAVNYNWMNKNNDAVPHRIARLLRQWGQQYPRGMRVLRRVDNQNPVGFYLLYPTAPRSDVNFFRPAKKALHLSTMAAVDPFTLATVGDETCVSVFIRSWVIDPTYLTAYRLTFLVDAQQTLRKMQGDFPNLCDLHTLIIHPSYAQLATTLGFQPTQQGDLGSIHWMYQALDRFLVLDIATAIASLG
ncbi:hypothetical protein [Picosynechococcus sp. PCC 7117]|uniref:hypothetical protein n=1 Tax=Picosynechococcus sp. PCC 7117 TaxID=195498 RepID=UPI0009FD9CC9|nr:hypothetical protein [Picosynechococcus sp. PCC 7117]